MKSYDMVSKVAETDEVEIFKGWLDKLGIEASIYTPAIEEHGYMKIHIPRLDIINTWIYDDRKEDEPADYPDFKETSK